MPEATISWQAPRSRVRLAIAALVLAVAAAVASVAAHQGVQHPRAFGGYQMSPDGVSWN